MVNATDADEEIDDTGPSLAMPPLFVLRAADNCPKCREAVHVYTLGCAAFHDSQELGPTQVFHFLRMIQSLPDDVMALLGDKCPGYRLDRDATSPDAYLMNHCRCGAKLDDDHVTGDVGTAFFPDTPDDYASIRPFLLSIDDPVPVVSSYSIGGDEYLDLDNAEPW